MLIRKLFPLNRCRRLCGDIIHNPIDALAFIDSTSYGIRAKSAVMKSVVVTPRSANV